MVTVSSEYQLRQGAATRLEPHQKTETSADEPNAPLPPGCLLTVGQNTYII